MTKNPSHSKASLAITLSKLKVFANPNERQEQYPTDSEIAAELLWSASMQGDLEGKNVIDLGCGTGILGIGAILLGAAQCTFVDSDDKAIAILQENLKAMRLESKADIICANIEDAAIEKAHVVLQNPPFGTREKHIDTLFLAKAFEQAPLVYSFHKTSTFAHIKKFAEQHGFAMTHQFNFDFPLKATLTHHRRKIHRIAVSAGRFAQQK